MKKVLGIVLLIAVLISATFMVEKASAFYEAVSNGGFETGDISGWSINPPLGYLIVTAPVHSGTYSVNIGDGNHFWQSFEYPVEAATANGIQFNIYGDSLGQSGYTIVILTFEDLTQNTFNAQDYGGWELFDFPFSSPKKLIKIEFQPIGHVDTGGVYIDDVSLIGVSHPRLNINDPWKWIIHYHPWPGLAQNLTMDVTNVENYAASFNLTAEAKRADANSTLLGVRNVNLNANETVTLTWLWDTTGYTYGNYTVDFYAWGDNLTGYDCLTLNFAVTIPGDISGDFRVQLGDLVFLANAYGTRVNIDPPGFGLHQWNPDADINGNNVVDLPDLVILANHYGQHYP